MTANEALHALTKTIRDADSFHTTVRILALNLAKTDEASIAARPATIDALNRIVAQFAHLSGPTL